ncbi:MAG TPA: hypothetical protein VKY54_12670 [Kiloniellales bacterium]|mgnify:FL=1|nr:hypothetical protein [Kiloniellales bacterium]
MSRPPFPPAIYVWSLEQACLATACASEEDCPLLLLCPEESAALGGVPWFKSLVDKTARGKTLDLCLGLEAGCDGALAHEALQLGLDLIVFEGSQALREKLAAIAHTQGALVLAGAPPALSLAGLANPEEACRAWLKDNSPRS